MKKTAGELAELIGGRLDGRPSETIERLADLDSAGPGDLSYAEARFSDRVPLSRASCILVSGGEFPGRTTIQVSNPKAAFARAAAWLVPSSAPPPGIHPASVIDADAEIGPDVSVGAHVVIERGARVGARTAILPGSHIGSGCRIGIECTIHPKVVLYPEVVLGDRVILHSGVVLGSDGFGYVRDGGKHLKFPQIGSVVIEDDVEIGANTTVDRGSLGRTVIGRGSKLDNLCHVGHNVTIGERTVIAAQTGISGSVRIGDDVVIAGQVGIGERARIDDGAVIGGQCGILGGKRIRSGEIIWGTPARPLKDVRLQHVWVARLPRMAAELERLRRSVEES